MADVDTLQQAELDRGAELRAALLAGEDTAAVRADIRRIQQRISRAIAKAADVDQERQRFNAAAQRRHAEFLANDIRASLVAQLAEYEPPAPLTEGNHQ